MPLVPLSKASTTQAIETDFEDIDKDEENDTSDITDNLTSEIRKDQHFLVLSDLGPLVMTKNKDKAIATLKCVKQNNRKALIIDINAKNSRLLELGTNLFKHKITEENRKNIMTIRNKVISEYLDYQSDHGDIPEQVVWKRIARKHNFSDHETYDKWNQWALDVYEYSQYNTKFNLE